MENYDEALEKAFKLLKIRPHSTTEIRRKLMLRNFNAETIAAVTKSLLEEGQVNDAEFARVYLDSLLRFKTWGYFGLKAKLMQRGIEGLAAEALLNEMLTIEAETDLARRVADKEKNLDKVKLAQKLSRKGFRSDVIRAVIKE